MKRPARPSVRLAGLLSAALLLAGCPKRPPHPGALDTFDSNVYDVLLTSQAILDQAKSELAAGKLPASAKHVINTTGLVYNTARDAWLGYRAVKQAGKPPHEVQSYVDKINALLPQLNNFIADLKKLMGVR